MNPNQLWTTTMVPSTQTILKVETEDAFEANQLFETLKGDEEGTPRLAQAPAGRRAESLARNCLS